MNDHNLDDLIIDTPEQQGGKAKGILTIIAMLIIIMIAAIVLTKIILKDPDAQPAVLQEDESALISPELTLQNAIQEPTPKTAEQKPKTPSYEEKTLALPQDDIKPETTSIEEEPTQIPKPTTKPVSHKNKPQREVVKVPTSAVPKPHTKPKTKPKPVAKPKTTHTTAKQKPTPKPVAAQGEYYIQVGSFSKTPPPNSRLISTIRNQGFKHRIFTINGMKKLVIGPYPSRAAADRAIVRVKALINKSAFVIKR